MKSQQIMTEGSVWKKIVLFAIPLFFGNLFQQLYNLSDSFIVSKLAGEQAFGSITTTGSFVFFFVGFFNGLATGAGVVIAKYFGARDKEKTQKAVHTDFLFGLVCAAVITLIGVTVSPALLKYFIQVPEALYENSLIYVSVYFGGSVTVIMYNICMGIMQAAGDSKHPLIYLIISSILNVGLDCLFVGVFHWGVGGAAIATVISQGVSAVLCIVRLCREKSDIQLDFKKLGFDREILKEILVIGLPAGLQNSIISIANMVVQANINSFGDAATIGCGSYAKVDGFAFLPITCFSLALTTFISQNLGAKEYDRAKKGALFGCVCMMVLSQLIGFAVCFGAQWLIPIFAESEEAVAYGVAQSHITPLFYFLLAYTYGASAVLRGGAKSALPMFTMLICWCVIRILFVTITIAFVPVIEVVFWAYPLTWALSSVLLTVFLFVVDWLHGHEKREQNLKNPT